MYYLLNYHLYFRDWLFRGWGLTPPKVEAVLKEPLSNTTRLTLFRAVRLLPAGGAIQASPVSVNSSGDFLSLASADGFAREEPDEKGLGAGTVISVIPYNPLW